MSLKKKKLKSLLTTHNLRPSLILRVKRLKTVENHWLPCFGPTNHCTGPWLSAGHWEEIIIALGHCVIKILQKLKTHHIFNKNLSYQNPFKTLSNAFWPHLGILCENWLHLRGRRHNHSPVPPSACRHTPHRFSGWCPSCPGYRSNLEEMGEKQSETLDRSRFSGGDTNLLVPLFHLMVEQNLGPLPPT